MDLLERIREAFETRTRHREMRLHGDCHRGNVLWTDAGPHFVDLDDCITGPAIQDLWMLLVRHRAREMGEQLGTRAGGLHAVLRLSIRELVLIESLRTLRMIHYSAWLARRWSDPAFPAHFPGSTSRAIGRIRCSLCANSWRQSMKARWSCRRRAEP